MGTVTNILFGKGVLSIKYPVGGSWRDLGYTDKGVVLTLDSKATEIHVDEETGPVLRTLAAASESAEIKVDLKEMTLANLDLAIPGSSVAGSTLSFGIAGGSAVKQMALKFVYTSQNGGAIYTVTMALCTADANVSQTYKLGENVLVPCTFKALKTSGYDMVTIVKS